MNRRNFVKITSASGILLGVSPLAAYSGPKKELNILVLGGTDFLGPAIVEAAKQKGHKITLFNRGITNPLLFSDLELIKGDREKGPNVYDPLKDRQWDVVIDVWPQKSQLVDEATEALKKNAEHYVFISSIAVYDNFQEVGLHENSDVVVPGGNRSEWGYSQEKIVAEGSVRDRFPERHTIMRPGPIIGYRDPALDLLYWLVKLKRNQDILAPGSGKDPLQFIDVKDVGRFTITAVENKLAGTFNTTGPVPNYLPWTDFLHSAKKHLNSTSKLYWGGEDFLKEHKVRSFDDLPLWAPLSEDKGFMQISMKKAVSAGFQFTPMEQTIDDCLKWFALHHPNDFDFSMAEEAVGLSRSKEAMLIRKLRSKKKS
jgi:2'-hydroxyisoflavone reductase